MEGFEWLTPAIVLGTAHPAKFPDAVKAATGVHPRLPAHLADLHERKERYTVLPNDLGAADDGLVQPNDAAAEMARAVAPRLESAPQRISRESASLPEIPRESTQNSDRSIEVASKGVKPALAGLPARANRPPA